MGNSTALSLSGFADLEKELDNLSKAAGRGVLRRSLMKAAKPTVEIAKSLAPDDSGKLRDSIIVGAKLDKRQAAMHRKMFRDDKASVELFMGPSYLRGAGGRHGHLLEFGTSPFINKGQFAGTQNPGIAPQPFMRPAWDQDRRAMLDRLKDDLWAEIQKATARAERKAARLAKG